MTCSISHTSCTISLNMKIVATLIVDRSLSFLPCVSLSLSEDVRNYVYVVSLVEQ